MNVIIGVIVVFIILEHALFFILESFLWTHKKTRKIFGLKSLEFAEETKVLAANQGVYNSFLSAGLLISFIDSNSYYISIFLIFVTIAGIIGSLTTKKKTIFLVQSIPAIIALVLIFLTK